MRGRIYILGMVLTGIGLMKRTALAISLLGLLVAVSSTHAFTTISVDFMRTIEDANKSETVRGVLYHDSDKTTIRVTYPLDQWMILEGNRILIYYPDDERAFDIKTGTPVNMPFFKALESAMKADYGLSEAGFELENHEVRGDTLLSYWKPPKKARDQFGRIVLALEDDRIVSTDIQDPKGRTLVRTTYESHLLRDGVHLPLQTTSVSYSGTRQTVERIVYSNPRFDEPLPQEVLEFRVPETVEVNEVEW
jgi:hypothetical protein